MRADPHRQTGWNGCGRYSEYHQRRANAGYYALWLKEQGLSKEVIAATVLYRYPEAHEYRGLAEVREEIDEEKKSA
jgi:hypothetical protein